MLKKSFLASIILFLGVVVTSETKELQRERGSRRIRMMRNIQQGEREVEFIDLSSP